MNFEERFSSKQVADLVRHFHEYAEAKILTEQNEINRLRRTVSETERTVRNLEGILRAKSPATYKKWEALDKYSSTYQEDLAELIK